MLGQDTGLCRSTCWLQYQQPAPSLKHALQLKAGQGQGNQLVTGQCTDIEKVSREKYSLQQIMEQNNFNINLQEDILCQETTESPCLIKIIKIDFFLKAIKKCLKEENFLG